MARQVRRISELPEATELTGDELLEIVQDGGNKRVAVDQLSGGGGAVQSVQGRTGDVVITAEDVGLGSVDNTSDADKPVSAAQQAALDGKVDKVAGMGLSSNDFTDPLRDKLIGLEGTHWRGTFVSLAALQAGVTDPAAGDYADVDIVGDDVARYIWDATDGIWVVQSGAVAPITASQVKQLYESNPDTNAFTDADEAKLGGIEAGATANSTDAYLLDRANHTGTQTISTVDGLQGELDVRVLNNDSRLTNSREWTATTVSQAEAEAGTATTRRAWTAQRVRQAIAAWWDSTASASGKTVATGTPAQGRTALGLGAAATADVTTSPLDVTAGRVMQTGDGGLLTVSSDNEPAASSLSDYPSGFWPVRAGLMAPLGSPETANKPSITVKTTPTRGFTLIGNLDGLISNTNPKLWLSTFNTELIEPLPAVEFLSSGNTTVDSNGFIKSASPIIKLHSDRAETEAPAVFERIDTGLYRLTDCNGLRLDDGWYIETPHDRNKVPYFNVEWEQDHEPDAEAGVLDEPADVTLTIRCYERVWNQQTGTYDNGDPVDIPEGRWIDLRMNEVRQAEPEMPDEPEQPVPLPEPAEPYIPSVVTMAQAKLALLYAGLFEAAEQYINELPEPQKTAALIEWNHRQTLERDHPLVGQVADGLGLTEQHLDELFLDASLR